mgnify:CR=1 FL=1
MAVVEGDVDDAGGPTRVAACVGHVDTESGGADEGFVAGFIGAHGTEEVGVEAEAGGVGRKIERRAAEEPVEAKGSRTECRHQRAHRLGWPDPGRHYRRDEPPDPTGGYANEHPRHKNA